MNSYIHLMNQVIGYIEDNISETLTLQEISSKFYLSEFHFSRIFRILVGYSMKQYIQRRKLSLVAEKLKNSNYTITMAAMEYGYKSPEVCSRAFKKQFGISPSDYRNGDMSIELVAKANVVVRDITNHKGSFALKNSFVYLDSTDIYGSYTEVNEHSSDFEQILNSTGSDFLLRYSNFLTEDKLFSIVNCHGDDSGRYTVFFGGSISKNNRDRRLKPFTISKGWYACFRYYGDMLEIRNTFVEDLYRWIIIKEIELSSNGIGMLDIYNLKDIKDVNILVPVKAPLNTAKNVMHEI